MAKLPAIILFIVLLGGVAALLYLTDRKGTAKDAQQTQEINARGQILEAWNGWFELVGTDYRPFLRGKVVAKHEDSIFFGYGFLVTKNLNQNFVRDLESLNPEFVDEKIFIQFGIDVSAYNIFTDLKVDHPDRRALEKLLTDRAGSLNLVNVWMSTLEFALPRQPEEIEQFEQMWAEAK